MKSVRYYSTNDRNDTATFSEALLRGMGNNYGLYMMAKDELPKIDANSLLGMPYSDIARVVLQPMVDIPVGKLDAIVRDAYQGIEPSFEEAGNRTIMWLTNGPTYSFKDYAARFYGRALDHALLERGMRRTVLVATSGDTGGAIADALFGLDNVDVAVFYPSGSISPGQRRQMTTLQRNVYAFEVDGDFDVCQELAKQLLDDHAFAKEMTGDAEGFTSANSISIGRLLPQTVFPWWAYANLGERFTPVIPSGNFGDMMGTVLAKYMGLPIETIVTAVNENRTFPRFMLTEEYQVKATHPSPSSAMNVAHPNNMARLFDLYDGHIFDERNSGEVIRKGVIDRMPDIDLMRSEITAVSVSDAETMGTIGSVYSKYGIILDPHGAVAWKGADKLHLPGALVLYETADPGKFPVDVQSAIGVEPIVPKGMQEQALLEERIYRIDRAPVRHVDNSISLSPAQYEQAKALLKTL